jgi:predicted dehydrogenase
MIRVAFIGTGGISAAHLRYLKTRKDVQIVGLCDIREDNWKRRQAEFGGEGFSDFNRMLDHVKPDAVWLCTPPQVRHEPLVACAERKIPAFCEKPVHRTLGAAQDAAAALRERNARVQVGYVFRSMPTVERLKKAMAGDSVYLAQSFYGCPMSVTRSMAAWFFDKAVSGGALIDQATHNFDLLRMLMGEVAEVKGLASNPMEPKQTGYTIDEVIALGFRFASGAVGGHTHTWVGDAWRNELLLSGKKRLYRLDLGRGTLTVEEGSDQWSFRQNQAQMYEHQNARFLDMVSSGDWSRNPCTFDDGVASLDLTLRCDHAVSVAAAA